ncbi:MAG: hypothetical protein N2255_09945 [Kiritimatiellae bacterium]|nr:hypothetical protein [Kiritimatiellia bacterium]
MSVLREEFARASRTRRLRSTRRLRFLLLLLGGGSLAIAGVLLLVSVLFQTGSPMRRLGLAYLWAGLSVLVLRTVFVQIDRYRKRKYTRR